MGPSDFDKMFQQAGQQIQRTRRTAIGVMIVSVVLGSAFAFTILWMIGRWLKVW